MKWTNEKTGHIGYAEDDDRFLVPLARVVWDTGTYRFFLYLPSGTYTHPTGYLSAGDAYSAAEAAYIALGQSAGLGTTVEERLARVSSDLFWIRTFFEENKIKDYDQQQRYDRMVQGCKEILAGVK
jgi:hypothetical protein